MPKRVLKFPQPAADPSPSSVAAAVRRAHAEALRRHAIRQDFATALWFLRRASETPEVQEPGNVATLARLARLLTIPTKPIKIEARARRRVADCLAAVVAFATLA